MADLSELDISGFTSEIIPLQSKKIERLVKSEIQSNVTRLHETLNITIIEMKVYKI